MSFPDQTGSDTKKIAIFIDIGSSYVKVSTWVDREDAPSPSMQKYHRPAGAM
jgi:hypothetical protein